MRRKDIKYPVLDMIHTVHITVYYIIMVKSENIKNEGTIYSTDVLNLLKLDS